MRQKRVSNGAPTRSEDGKTSPRRSALYRGYALFVAIVICYFLFRFFTIWGALLAIAPKARSHQSCWQADLNSSAGAAPCHDYGVKASEDNAKVALLFLVRHNIPTEPIWTAFIAAAAELKLRQSVPPTAPGSPALLPSSRNDTGPTPTCGIYLPPTRSPEPLAEVPMQPITNTTRWLQRTLRTPLTPRELYERQDLFSIYVHRTPGFEERVQSSIFYGRDIEERIPAAISQPSLVSAHKALLRAALEDPRNTMFVLVSDVCVPLHHPALMWTQLMAESHISRVSGIQEDLQRWQVGMEYGSLDKKKFYKSSQWVGLTRMHAMLVTQDDHVWPRFDRFCRTGVDCGPDLDLREGSCIADEHFVATLLAVYQQQEESTVAPYSMPLTHLVFPPGHHHPTTFMSGHFQQGIDSMKCGHWAGWERQYEHSLASTRSLFFRDPIPTNSRFWGFSRSLLDDTSDADQQDLILDGAFRSRALQKSGVVVYQDSFNDVDSNGLNGSSGVVGGARPWGAVPFNSSTEENGYNTWIEALPGSSQSPDEAPVTKKVPLDPETMYKQLEKGQRLKDKLRERLRNRDPNAPPLLRGVSDSTRQRREKKKANEKIAALEAAMRKNLARDKWLGRFKPLNMGCPLLGRRVSVDAVSEWASKAWDCDGLGYAWKCIQKSREYS